MENDEERDNDRDRGQSLNGCKERRDKKRTNSDRRGNAQGKDNPSLGRETMKV